MTDAELQDTRELALNLTGNDREEMRHMGGIMLTLIDEITRLRNEIHALRYFTVSK